MVASGARLAAAEPITLESLIAEATTYDAVARWPDPAFTCRQASSYDRRRKGPGQPDWFANDDHSQYVRSETVDGRLSHVLMDADGPGAIVRFWSTTNAVKQGRLRIVLDGAAAPALEFPAFDLLSGGLPVGAPWITAHPGYAPRGGGGGTCYLPIPYARHCLVTWEDADPAQVGPRYYQIDYRTYAPGTPVATFTAAACAAAQETITRAGHRLEAPPDAVPGRIVTLNQTIPAGGEAWLDLPAGAAAVRRLAFLADPADAAPDAALRALVVRMQCDGEDTVWCPVSDFLGSGLGINALRSWYRSVSADGAMACRWTMPYRTTARIGLRNLADRPLPVTLLATVAEWAWDARSMHFHATWRQQAGITAPPAHDWNLVGISGRGVYVGDGLAIFNPVATWYGEGDEKIRVDHEAFPSHLGTGTEDYYNYSWAPQPVFQTPFANLVRVDEKMTRGWNVCTRTRNLDGIPFTSALDFDFEIMPWKTTSLTYAATTCWYALPGATTRIAPMPEEALRPIARVASAPGFADACECEAVPRRVLGDGVTTELQAMDAWGGERWSGGAQLLIRAHRAGDAVELAIPVTGDAPRTVVLHATRAPDYGLVRLDIAGGAATTTFDGFATGVEPSGTIALGSTIPHEGRILLRVEFAGRNPRSTGDGLLMGLDCVVVTPR